MCSFTTKNYLYSRQYVVDVYSQFLKDRWLVFEVYVPLVGLELAIALTILLLHRVLGETGLETGLS